MDESPPKLLMEIVDQISIPLERVFSLSLKEGGVLFERKYTNIISLFKKDLRNKSDNNRPVSLKSVIRKLLGRLIKEHMVDFLVRHNISKWIPKSEVMLNKYVMFFGRNHQVDTQGIASRYYLLRFSESF